MLGFSSIGEHALGELIIGSSIIYNPVSRLTGGGLANLRPKQVYITGVDLVWDDGNIAQDTASYIVWDNGDVIAWES